MQNFIICVSAEANPQELKKRAADSIRKQLKDNLELLSFMKGNIMIQNPLGFIKKAQKEGYAIGAFNIHNLETMQAVVGGAVKTHSPVIIATTLGTINHAGIENITAMINATSLLNDIPIALHADHCSSYEVLETCVKNGYSSIMIDASALPYEENIDITKRVVRMAHVKKVCVEAELGKLGGIEDDIKVDAENAMFTDPKQAVDFVERTGIDTLAIAIGTAHGLYKGEPLLDYNRLKEIRSLVELPLVLHGASGVPFDSIRYAISLGISKVNIATELKIPFADAIKKVFAQNPDESDPRKYMGAGRAAAQEMVEYKINMCGCNNKA